MSEPDEQIRFVVSPEPTPEMMAVISAAVVAIARQRSNGNGADTVDVGGGRERWSRAGRREVLRPFDRD